MPLPSHRLFVSLTALGCIALVSFLLLDLAVAAAIAKLIASTAFIATAVGVGGLRSVFGRLILLGLAFSWAGDAFLIGDSRSAFLLGLVAFLLAHLSYIAAFIVFGVSKRWAMLGAIPVVAAAIAVSLWLAPHLPGGMNVPVWAYTVVISVMLIAAIGTRGQGAPATIPVGAFLFFVSDLSVAALRLVEVAYPTYVWGLPLYYAGQTLLALSASQSRSHCGVPENRSARKSIKARTL